MRCDSCLWCVVVGDGWRYCVLNSVWVGDSDACSAFWSGVDWLNFVVFYNCSVNNISEGGFSVE